MPEIITVNTVKPRVRVKLTDVNGSPVTSYTHLTAGLTVEVLPHNAAVFTEITPLAAATGGEYTEKGFVHTEYGWYDIGLSPGQVAPTGSSVLRVTQPGGRVVEGLVTSTAPNGGPLVVGTPYDYSGVSDEMQRIAVGQRSASAGVSVIPIRVLEGATLRFGVDCRELTAHPLTQVTAVGIEAFDAAGDAIATWSSVPYNGFAGAVMERMAIVTLEGHSAGDTATVTVTATDDEGRTIQVEVPIEIET